MVKGTEKLAGVHPLLVKIVNEAGLHCGLRITYGLRTLREQRVLFAQGKSKTMKSKHLPQADGLSHAIDFVPSPFDGNWNNLKQFTQVADQLKIAAMKFRVPFEYGGDWKSFKDYPHFQVNIK